MPPCSGKLVSVKEDNLDAFREATKGMQVAAIGQVTSGVVELDHLNWGDIRDWQYLYDHAIENYLAKETAGSALSSI
jgi:phosphoribosylformylglycinamidine synthase subunit PurL